MDITTIQGGKGICDPDLCHGHLLQKDSVKSYLKHLGCEFLRSCVKGSGSFDRLAVDYKHQSGLAGPISAFVTAVTVSRARLSMDGKGAWTASSFTKRFWRSLKVEVVTLKVTDSVAEATPWVNRTIDKVNSILPHTSHGDKHLMGFNHQHQQKYSLWHPRKTSQTTYFSAKPVTQTRASIFILLL